MRLSRGKYVARYGPTAGDRIRLGDTNLWARVEIDHTASGDEAMWGYAKNLRSRLSQFDAVTTESELDMVVLGVVVMDPLLGVVKADIGIKDGRIAGVGRAGNPDITDGVDLRIGPNTWPVNGHGLIATTGAIDSHVHLITPRGAATTTATTTSACSDTWRSTRWSRRGCTGSSGRWEALLRAGWPISSCGAPRCSAFAPKWC